VPENERMRKEEKKSSTEYWGLTKHTLYLKRDLSSPINISLISPSSISVETRFSLSGPDSSSEHSDSGSFVSSRAESQRRRDLGNLGWDLGLGRRDGECRMGPGAGRRRAAVTVRRCGRVRFRILGTRVENLGT
jgi:hypothetical protein